MLNSVFNFCVHRHRDVGEEDLQKLLGNVGAGLWSERARSQYSCGEEVGLWGNFNFPSFAYPRYAAMYSGEELWGEQHAHRDRQVERGIEDKNNNVKLHLTLKKKAGKSEEEQNSKRES